MHRVWFIALILGLAAAASFVSAACGDLHGAMVVDRELPAEEIIHLPGGAVGVTDPGAHAAQGSSSILDDSLVMGVRLGTATRAYRITMLEELHIVNDMLQGEPLAVTYCTMCAAGVTFLARVEGHPRLTFTTRAAWQGVMLMEDEQTGSRWRQLDGRCVSGPLRGHRLERVATVRQVRWDDWRRAHPGTSLMAAEDEQAAAAYESLRRAAGTAAKPEFVRERLPAEDGRLPNESLVYGLSRGAVERAWTLAWLADHPVQHVRLDDLPVVVLYDARVPTVLAFDRRVEGRVLAFESWKGGLRDRETGTRWTLDGIAVDGPLRDTVLTPVPGMQTQWYAWRTVHPKTTLQR